MSLSCPCIFLTRLVSLRVKTISVLNVMSIFGPLALRSPCIFFWLVLSCLIPPFLSTDQHWCSWGAAKCTLLKAHGITGWYKLPWVPVVLGCRSEPLGSLGFFYQNVTLDSAASFCCCFSGCGLRYFCSLPSTALIHFPSIFIVGLSSPHINPHPPLWSFVLHFISAN